MMSASSTADNPAPTFEGPEKILSLKFSISQNPNLNINHHGSFASLTSTSASASGCCSEASECDSQGQSAVELDVDRRQPSLKNIAREQWDAILMKAQCEILHDLKGELVGSSYDAYVLSESSLFVDDYTAYIKTCGTTTLLLCLPMLLSEANEIGLELCEITFGRKNYLFPERQRFPHCSFAQEVDYLRNFVHGHQAKLNITCIDSSNFRSMKMVSEYNVLDSMGDGIVLGDLKHDFFCLASVCSYNLDSKKLIESPGLPSIPEVEDMRENLRRIKINVMMHELDSDILPIFYRQHEDHPCRRSEGLRAREQSGISRIFLFRELKEDYIDDTMYEPCGYSLNALDPARDGFATIHITPERQISYASFEADMMFTALEINTLVFEVLGVFNPGKVSVTLSGTGANMDWLAKQRVPFRDAEQFGEYSQVQNASTVFKNLDKWDMISFCKAVKVPK